MLGLEEQIRGLDIEQVDLVVLEFGHEQDLAYAEVFKPHLVGPTVEGHDLLEGHGPTQTHEIGFVLNQDGMTERSIVQGLIQFPQQIAPSLAIRAVDETDRWNGLGILIRLGIGGEGKGQGLVF